MGPLRKSDKNGATPSLQDGEREKERRKRVANISIGHSLGQENRVCIFLVGLLVVVHAGVILQVLHIVEEERDH